MSKSLETMGLREKVLWLLSSKEKYGGPQSIQDVCTNLKISNTNARSVLVRLNKIGKIERIGKGIYKIAGDDRDYVTGKPNYKP